MEISAAKNEKKNIYIIWRQKYKKNSKLTLRITWRRIYRDLYLR